jgi:arylsulfatase A-like enzyme
VVDAAIRAVESGSHHDRWFVYVDSFDPHEPWHIPEPYRSMYGPYSEEHTCWPPYPWCDTAEEFFAQVTPAQLGFIRQQYAGNVTMVDRQLGRLFESLDDRRLWESTAVILTTDHGHDLGERGCYGKGYPHWSSHARIPLIIWHPDHPGPRRFEGYSTMVDVHATVAELFGVRATDRGESLYRPPDGRSLLPGLAGLEEEVRSGVLYGTYGLGACRTDDEYTFFSGYDNRPEMPLWYSAMPPRSGHAADAEAGKFIPGVDVPVWRMRRLLKWKQPERMPPQVFARADEAQLRDLAAHEPTLAECRRRLRAAIRDIGAPAEQYRRLMIE